MCACVCCCDTIAWSEPVQLEPLLQLPVQHASINATLGGTLQQFDYNSPASICGFPHAARNAALVWGMFAALLLLVVTVVKQWLGRKQSSASARWWPQCSGFTDLYNHQRMLSLRGLADCLWFLVSDVAWLVYAQVSNVVTIHQVFKSGQLQFAYTLLGILVLPFAITFAVIACVSIRVCQVRSAGGGLLHRGASVATGLLLAPAFYVICWLALVCHGIGLPLPEWFEVLGVDLCSLYCLQSLAETLFNALPQSMILTKLYIMGNDPSGIHVYIDTRLYLFSIIASLLSMLKSLAIVMIECHTHSCRFADYCITLLRLESLEVYKELRGTSLTCADLVSRSNTSVDIPR